MNYRGLSDDLSRGPVDTLEFQKKLIRTLAAYKDNLYSPYFENTQQYASNPLPAPPGGSISAADARELVAYAAQLPRHDRPRPGSLRPPAPRPRLRAVLSNSPKPPTALCSPPASPARSRSSSRCSLSWPHLYPSPFLHIGADETVDLGLGQTKPAVDAQGLGPVYLDFMQQIDTTLRPLNRRLLFWGDIAENSPDLLKACPRSSSRTPSPSAGSTTPPPPASANTSTTSRSAGFETWVSPGSTTGPRLPQLQLRPRTTSSSSPATARQMGATGQLNTLWYDDGEALACQQLVRHPLRLRRGLAAGRKLHRRSSRAATAQVFHGDTTGKLNQAQHELMAAHDLLKFEAKVGDGSDGLFWIDPWSKDGQDYAAKLRPYTHELRLHAERALDLIAQARAAYPPPPGCPIHSLRGWPIVIGRPSSSARIRGGAIFAWPCIPDPPFHDLDPATCSPPTPPPSANPTPSTRSSSAPAASTSSASNSSSPTKWPRATPRPRPAPSPEPRTRRHVSSELSDINGVNGRIQDIKDGYSLLRDLYAQTWLRTNRPYALRPVLEHYDYTIGLWLTRMDKVRNAQRQWADTKTLPSAAEAGIPAPPPAAPPAQAP